MQTKKTPTKLGSMAGDLTKPLDRNFTPNQLKNQSVQRHAGIIRHGTNYTKSKASNLYVNEVFPHPDFIGLGVGRLYPQGRAHRFGGVVKPHVHSSGLTNQRMVFDIPKGIKAMKPTTTGASPTTTHDHHQTDLFFQASNHLALALHSLRHATGDQGIKTAAGRANAAARALNQLAGGLSNV